MKICFFIFLLIASTAYAAPVDKMFEASQFYEAGEFDKALEVYDELLKAPLQPWEMKIVKYDSGCVYQASGNNLQAISLFNSISLKQEAFPLLFRNIKTNLAVAYLKEERQVALHSLESFSKALFYLWESQAAVASAQTADCLLVKAEGAAECRPALDLVNINDEIKVEFAKVFEGIRTYWIKDATLKEGLPLLVIGTHQMEHFTKLLNKGLLSGKLLDDYLEFGRMKGEEWLPLWEEQEKLVVDEQFKIQFLKAKNLYKKGLNEMANGALTKTESSLAASGKTLMEFIHTAYGEHPIYERLQMLLVFYQTALLQDPLQISMLAALQNDALEAAELLSDNKLEASNRYLSEALEFLKKGDPHTRLSLLKAYREVELVLRKVRPPADNLPMVILEDGIEDQRYAIIFNRQLIKLGETSQEEEIAQRQVSSDAEAFGSAALAWQIEAFHKKGNFTPEDLCQSQPWDEVYPLFDQGRQSVKKALLLQGEAALAFQERALDAWQQALQKLKDPKKSTTSLCKGAQQVQKGQSQQKSGQQTKETPSFEQVAGQLIRMQEEDRLPKKQTGISIEVEKPW
jgi:hypothetical protein